MYMYTHTSESFMCCMDLVINLYFFRNYNKMSYYYIILELFSN